MSKNPFGRGGWTPARLPDLTGTTTVITGANSGIGLEAATELAGRGTHQIWLCRNEGKAAAARDAVLSQQPEASITILPMDLSDLDSVSAAAQRVLSMTEGIHALINNAGIMMLPTREQTAQGFEKQIGVNHFGHFALNAQLAERVEAVGGRFVSVASVAHRGGTLHRDDLFFDSGYGAIKAYGQSKLANILYIRELDRRLEAAGCSSQAIACHPGYSATNLQTTGPSKLWGAVMKVTNAIVAQGADRGAWPTLLAAFDPEAERGGYYGPTGMGETRGAVGPAGVASQATNADDQKWLWEKSVELTGLSFAIL